MDKNNNGIRSLDALVTCLIDRIYDNTLAFETNAEKEKTASYWEVGKFIKQHLAFHNNDLMYTRRVYTELSKKLKVGKRTLQRTAQLYTFYPDLDDINFSITWTHFKILLTVGLPEKRKEFEELIVANNLTSRELIELVKQYQNERHQTGESKLAISHGKLYQYKVIIEDDEPALDLGFLCYTKGFDIEALSNREITAYEVAKRDDSYHISLVEEVQRSTLYTYKTKIIRVIDGDTLFVTIDLGFKQYIKKKLRLRGINAPDIATEEGLQATEFITGKLSPLDFFIIKTYHPDRYGRYLTDVFYDSENPDPTTIITTGHFLNQELLDTKLATPYFKY